MVERFIVVTGNPVDGFTFNGPFFDHDEAETWASNNDNGETWWIAPLEGPL